MYRALIVWTCCAVFALLGIAGTHGHRFQQAEKNHHHQGSQHEHPSIYDPPTVVAASQASHGHEHLAHGAVDVDPPAKVFGKTPDLKGTLILFTWVGLLLFLIRVPSLVLRDTASRHSPRRSRHPFHLPPAHAPPLIA